ncbi:MAG: hypothetical protein IKM76_09555, partial [Prevotella sp.]|nr:hypothetical protein [Prevotella sp.]
MNVSSKRKLRTISLSFIICLSSLTPAGAQKQWTLRECCDYAVSHNISVKQQENQLQQRELQLET